MELFDIGAPHKELIRDLHLEYIDTKPMYVSVSVLHMVGFIVLVSSCIYVQLEMFCLYHISIYLN